MRNQKPPKDACLTRMGISNPGEISAGIQIAQWDSGQHWTVDLNRGSRAVRIIQLVVLEIPSSLSLSLFLSFSLYIYLFLCIYVYTIHIHWHLGHLITLASYVR